MRESVVALSCVILSTFHCYIYRNIICVTGNEDIKASNSDHRPIKTVTFHKLCIKDTHLITQLLLCNHIVPPHSGILTSAHQFLILLWH